MMSSLVVAMLLAGSISVDTSLSKEIKEIDPCLWASDEVQLLLTTQPKHLKRAWRRIKYNHPFHPRLKELDTVLRRYL